MFLILISDTAPLLKGWLPFLLLREVKIYCTQFWWVRLQRVLQGRTGCQAWYGTCMFFFLILDANIPSRDGCQCYSWEKSEFTALGQVTRVTEVTTQQGSVPDMAWHWQVFLPNIRCITSYPYLGIAASVTPGQDLLHSLGRSGYTGYYGAGQGRLPNTTIWEWLIIKWMDRFLWINWNFPQPKVSLA